MRYFILVFIITASLGYKSVTAENVYLDSGPIGILIPPGAVPAGMGYAYTALSEHSPFLAWNPAQLAWTNRSFQGSYTYGSYNSIVREFSGEAGHCLEACTNFNSAHTAIGLQIMVYDTDHYELRGSNNEYLGEISETDFDVNFSLGTLLSDTWAIGASLKIIRVGFNGSRGFRAANYSSRWDIFGKSEAVNLGVKHRRSLSKSNEFLFGVTLTNIGGRYRFSDGYTDWEESLPAQLRIGAAIRSQLDPYYKFTASFELDRWLVQRDKHSYEALFTSWTNNGNFFSKVELKEYQLHFGAELLFNNLLAFRAGFWNDGYLEIIPVTVGGGFVIKSTVRFDASYVFADEYFLDKTFRLQLAVTL